MIAKNYRLFIVGSTPISLPETSIAIIDLYQYRSLGVAKYEGYRILS